RMSRREVDAVLAHEISHLEHHHPLKTHLAAAGAWLLVAAAARALALPYGLPAGFAACWLIYLFVARRFQVAAAAVAAAVPADAEAMISGLGQLARLNDVPLEWGRGWRWLMTHPTTRARGLAVGRRAGLAPERVEELLTGAVPAAERYGHRE